MGWAPQFVALLLSPVATELPETLNAVIWVRQGRERLALANISGADEDLQATIPSALGLLLHPGLFDHSLLGGRRGNGICGRGVVAAVPSVGRINSWSLVPLASLYGVLPVIVAAVTHGN